MEDVSRFSRCQGTCCGIGPGQRLGHEACDDAADLLLLDGAKALYGHILDLLESRLRPGSMVVADNADYSQEYLARARAPGGGYLSVPFGPDVEVSVRLSA